MPQSLTQKLYDPNLGLPITVEDVEIIVQSKKEEDLIATKEALRNSYETIRKYLEKYELKYVLPKKVVVSDLLDGPTQTLYTNRGTIDLPGLPEALGAYTEYYGDQDVLHLNKVYLEGGTDVEQYLRNYNKACEICRQIAEDPNEDYGNKLKAAELYRGYRSVLAGINEITTEDIIDHELFHAMLTALGIFSPLDQMIREQRGDPTAKAHAYFEEGTAVLIAEQARGEEIVKEGHPYFEPKMFMKQFYLEEYGTDNIGKLISDAYKMGVNACKSFGRELRGKARSKLFSMIQQAAYGEYA